ncbi:MAG: tetratricopeptide repeat protein [Xenococcaceae cyanobacterium]
MSSSKREQAYRNLEEALSYWQEKLAYYKRELSISAGAAQRFELKKRIEECNQEIEKINPELKFLKQRNKTEQTLLHWVEHEVKSRLHSSLHNRTSILLGKEEDPSKVNPPWAIDVKIGSQSSSRLAPNITITDIYDREDINGRLLILGAPGSGKTTMLLQLAQELINRAQSDTKQPIPVLLNLSSWKDDKQSIKDWIIADLKLKYGVRKDIGKKWLEEDAIIPLLDGLDEVASARQRLCVERINQFLHPSVWSISLVVCSRTEEFQRLATPLELNGAIILQPLSSQQIQDYVLRTEGEVLWNSIKDDRDLMKLAKTPLFLNILVISWEEISFSQWQLFSSREERLSYLFDAYIRRMFNRPYQGKQPSQEKTRYWLEWLAIQLKKENKTEFFIEKIQPYWLNFKAQKFSYGLIFGLMLGLIYNLTSSLTYEVIGKQNFIEISLVAGIPIPLIYELMGGLTGKLIYGLIGGLIVGLIGGFVVSKIENFYPTPLWKKIKKGLIGGMIGGLIYGLMGVLIYRLMGVLIVGLSDWLSWLGEGVLFGSIFGLTINKIETVETLTFSLKKSRVGLIYGLIIGLIVGFIYGLIYGFVRIWGMDIYWLIGALIFELFVGLMYGLIGGMIGALIFGLIKGISGVEIDLKNIPNQGIKATSKNAIRLTAISLIIWLVIYFVIQYTQTLDLVGFLLLITYILTLTILFSIYSLIQHCSLRFVLWLSGYAPWNYARCLDYATDRLFLQRVGGGYRFIHRLLQEHFAQFWQPQIAEVCVPDSDKQVKPQQIRKRRRKKVHPLSRLELFVIFILTVAGFTVWQYFHFHKLSPKDAEVFYSRGLVYFNLENYQQAIENFNQAIQLNSQYAEAYYKLAEAYQNRGSDYFSKYDYQQAIQEYTEAIQEYTEAIQLNSQYAEAYYSRGLAYYRRGKVYLSLAFLDQEKNYQDYQVIKKENLDQEKNYQQAIENFNQAIQLNPQYAEAYYSRGEVYLDQGNYQQAIENLDQVIHLNPQHDYAYFNRGIAYYKIQNDQKAIADFTQVIKIKPDSADAYVQLGIVYHKQKNFNAALSNYKQGLLAKEARDFGNIILANRNIGLIKYEIGSIDEAIQKWQEVMVMALCSESQLALAVAFYVKGEQEKAFQMAEAVLKFDKRFADLEFLKKALWGERLLADAEKLFSTPRIQGFLSSEQP